jgi:formylglycine-generating enzyme required for sulfatase activity
MLAGLTHRERVTLEDYLIDRYEVTNEQFRQFIDDGGYRNQDYWNHPLVKEEKPLTWQAAMGEFVDKTGRSGPSTWELGSYPPGQGEYPVRGVSWYEAAAYALYAGKSLPTVIHWAHASSPWFGPQMIPLSNIGGNGPVPVGVSSAVSHFGAFDMAGNVKEWCWNASGENRFMLGGAWDEPVSRFSDPDTQSPFTRLATYGFRCADYPRSSH